MTAALSKSMTGPARQTTLPLKDARYRLPLMPVITAKGIIKDATEEDIADLITSGAVWAWNIATPKARREEYRILSRSVVPLAEIELDELKSRAFEGNIVRQPATWEEALAIIVPQPSSLAPQLKTWLTGREIKRALNCGRQHMINLVEAREERKPILALMPGTSYRQGPGGSPTVQRAAFINFLKARLVGGL